ncbi:MAG: MlaD family protein [Rickettsiales bacterium]|jgi:phospholipid/cholesterol/gamma-HCH transport system substrate-binding protein|nr:MlaD family protein [Rickettsiales bacterium]
MCYPVANDVNAFNIVMKKNYFDITIGAITVVISIFFVLFSMKITDKRLNQKFYTLYAKFSNIEGINLGVKVKICGVEVGKVSEIYLDGEYNAIIKMDIRSGVKIPADSLIRVSTSGIMSGKYLKIEAGGDTENLIDGENFEFTESSVDLEDMIARFMLNKVSSDKK